MGARHVPSIRSSRQLLVAAVLACAGQARGDVFNYITPVDVTPATTGSYVDVDVSAHVPSGATGVILQMVNTSGTGYHFGVRKNGSTDTFMTTTTKTAVLSSGGFYMIGVDGSRVFECYIENAAVLAYLVGYTTSGVTFFTNAVDHSNNAGDANFHDIDISADTGADTAIGAIFILKNFSGSARNYALRKKGSTDNRNDGLMAGHATMAMIGVNTSEICEIKNLNTNVDAFLVGYVTSGAVFFDNGVNLATATTASYVDTDITSSIASTDRATGAILELYGSSPANCAVRIKGGAYDYYKLMHHGFGICAVDNGDVFEQKISSTNMDLYLLGYTVESMSNYRSVGTNSGTIYSTGNCSITVDTSTMTFGGGASLPSSVGPGDRITAGAAVFHIATKDSATQVTVQEDAAATIAGQAYTITRAYNTFQAWETARQGDLVATDRSEIAVAYDDGDFTSGVTIDGSTTSTTRYMEIIVADGHGHSGAAGAGVVIDMDNAGTAITISDANTDVTGLQITRTGGANGRCGVDVVDATSVKLIGLLIHDFDTGHTCRGVRFGSNATGALYNCVVYDGGGYGYHADTGASSMSLLNCTVQGITGYGVLRTAGTLTAYDVLSMDSTTADFSGTIGGGNNISSDATAGGGGSLTSRASSNQFVSIAAGSEDLHLKSGSDAINTGTDNSDYYTVDFEGDARPTGSGWDRGADERAAGTTDINYRSVGTGAGTLYSTGTCSIDAGTSTVTFAGGASLPGNVGQGDTLTVGSTVFHLLSRDSATQATVQVSASATLANQAYTITRAYNSLSAWESARQGDLVSDDRREVAVCYDDGDFTTALTIDGSTTDATRYMMVTVADGQRHAGLAGDGAVLDMGNAGTGITISDGYTRVEWLRVTRTGGAALRCGILVTSAANVSLDSLLVHDFDTGAGSCYGIVVETSSSATVRNCVVYDGTGWGIASNAASATLTVQNCTVYGITGRGIAKITGSTTSTNCIAMGCSNTDFPAGQTQSYNMSSDASASGAGSLTSKTAASQFVSLTGGSEDFHLKTGADAINAGSDLSGSFTGDVDGEIRSASWDMGADERSSTTANYRSVGTNAGTIYSTGTASIAAGTSTATFGGGASLPPNVGAGDKLTIGATVFYMLSRDSATQATVQETAAGALTSEAYTIVRAYNTLQAWESARQGDLVAELRVEVAVVYDDGDLTSALTIDGSTTDDSHYMEVTVAGGHRHNGQAGAGAVLDMNDTATGITVSDDYARIGWLQVRRTGGANDRAGVRVTGASDVLLEGLLVYDFHGAAKCLGIVADVSASATVRNCIVYDGTGYGIYTGHASGELTVQNCTIYGITGRGVFESDGPITAVNCIAMDCTTEDFGTGIAQSYNMSSDASASGAGSLPGRDAADQFTYVLAGNLNLHLKSGSEAIDAGSDLSGSFAADVDYGSRSGAWDMGADESGVLGSGRKLTPRVAAWREIAP
jgi:hypothetical protein